MRNPTECPPLKFEGSGSAQDNFLPSMDIHGALYVHSWDCAVCTAGTVHCMCIVHIVHHLNIHIVKEHEP